MRQLAAAVMLVVGMALIVVGVGSATWWKDSPIVEATTESSSQSGIIATDPGVLELVDDTVLVTARAPGSTVEMVVASTEIASLWLGEEPHVSVTGLSSWTALATSDPAEDVAPAQTLSVAGSDLFHPENFITAEDSVELHFVVPAGDWTLIALGQDGTTPQLTLSWEREVSTPYAIPFSIVGIVLLAAGSALFIYHSQRVADAKRREASDARRARRRGADMTETSVLPALKNLRRDRRAEAAAGDEEERTELRDKTGGAFGAGILPASPRAEELRSAGADEDETADGNTIDGETADDAEHVDTNTEEHAGEVSDAPVEDHESTIPADSDGDDVSSASHEGTVDIDESDESAADGADGAADVQDESADDRRSTSAEWRSLWGFGQRSDDEEK